MESREILGAIITIIGLLLLLYSLVIGALHHQIGEAGKFSGDAMAAILGWFLFLLGPALWFGETPAKVKARAEEGGE